MKLTQRHVEPLGARLYIAIVACVVLGLATCASALALRMDVATGTASSATQSASPARPNISPDNGIAYKKPPVYPAKAKADKDTLNGSVVLAMTISKKGAPEDVHVTKTLRSDYDQSALDAVREWRWHPYLKDGIPVAVDTTVTITYSLPK